MDVYETLTFDLDYQSHELRSWPIHMQKVKGQKSIGLIINVEMDRRR